MLKAYLKEKSDPFIRNFVSCYAVWSSALQHETKANQIQICVALSLIGPVQRIKNTAPITTEILVKLTDSEPMSRYHIRCNLM